MTIENMKKLIRSLRDLGMSEEEIAKFILNKTK